MIFKTLYIYRERERETERRDGYTSDTFRHKVKQPIRNEEVWHRFMMAMVNMFKHINRYLNQS